LARLRIKYKDGERESIELSEKLTMIGRTPANTIQLRDQTASRKHCMINLEADVFLLRDMGSGNGTKVNGKRVQDSHTLSDGDRVQVGTTVLTFKES